MFRTEVANYPNGCHVCEVEIDPETGMIQILRYSVVDDVGTVMNPLLLKGQIVGGVVQGVGQILMEDIHFDADGQLVTGSFMDYAMPRASDLSPVEVKSNPVPTKTNPLGVKGAGEAGCVGAMPAVANAIAMRSRRSASSISKCRRRRNAFGVPSRKAARRLRSARLSHIAGFDPLGLIAFARKRGENFLTHARGRAPPP